MEDVFGFILAQLGKAFDLMQSFELFAGLNLFQFFIILLVLNAVITLFVPLLKKSGADKADKSKKGDS